MPCQFESTKEQAYHMCTPWKPGIAIYIMVIAQIAIVLANCFAGCIKPEVGVCAIMVLGYHIVRWMSSLVSIRARLPWLCVA